MSVNKVILVGHLGRDPEVRYIDQNTAVANFTLATTDRAYKSASGQEYPERTEWHNIVAWRGLASIAERFLRKGSPVYIEGKIRSRQYQDQQGNTRYISEIIADNLELLGRKGDIEITPLAPPTSGAGQSYAAPQATMQTTTSDSTPFDSPSDKTDLPF